MPRRRAQPVPAADDRPNWGGGPLMAVGTSSERAKRSPRGASEATEPMPKSGFRHNQLFRDLPAAIFNPVKSPARDGSIESAPDGRLIAL